MTRAHVKLLGPCFKTDRLAQGTNVTIRSLGKRNLPLDGGALRPEADPDNQYLICSPPVHQNKWEQRQLPKAEPRHFPQARQPENWL